MTFSARLWLILFCLCALVFAGCSMNKIAADSTAHLLADGAVALDRESDLEFARDAFPASLKTLETFLINSPTNPKLQFLLTYGFNSYAYGFLEGDLEKARLHGTQEEVDRLTRRAILHYLRARYYGFKVLDYPALEKAALAGDADRVRQHLANLEKADVPPLFWTTHAWAGAINLAQDDPDMVGALPVVELFLERILELDPGYKESMPRVFMATYFASRPPMFGGKPEEAKVFYDKAMNAHGDENLLIPYLYARFYATQVQDRRLFNELMAKVLEADAAQYPDLRLSNEIARERARFWVQNVDELFFE